jgi:hypothetical protein
VENDMATTIKALLARIEVLERQVQHLETRPARAPARSNFEAKLGERDRIREAYFLAHPGKRSVSAKELAEFEVALATSASH